MNRMPQFPKLMVWVAVCAALAVFSFPSFSRAEEEQPVVAEPKSLSLNLMVINPSKKYTQKYPIQAYLPDEVRQEDILDRQDLEIGFNAQKNAYFLHKEIELKPGESIVREIKIKDIWLVSNDKMKELLNEAQDLLKKLKDTDYEEQARLLANNIEVTLLQIVETQTDKDVTPEEHISIYRENKRRVQTIESDLMSLRRFLVASGKEGMMSGIGSTGDDELDKLLSGTWKEGLVEGKDKGTVPAWVLWKVIFLIIGFVGMMSTVFIWVFQSQARLRKRRQEPTEVPDVAAAPDAGSSIRLADLLDSNADATKKPDDKVA